MKCRNCGNIKELQNSHIIPEWMYKELYNSKHQFIQITEEQQSIKPKQKGFREYLLCKECELELSKIERYASIFFKELEANNTDKLFIDNIHDKCKIIHGYDFIQLKKFLLSLLWRMSISTLEPFKKYKLGPYEDKVKKIVFNEIKPTCFDYPIIMSKIYFDTIPANFFMLNTSGQLNNKTTYDIVIKGYQITYVIAENFKWNKINVFLDFDSFPIISNDFRELCLPKKLLDRFSSTEVQNFHKINS